MSIREITIAHSPDSDDAFMFYALAHGKIDTGHLHFKHILQDIETLNQKATQGVYDLTAISFHAYAYIADKYALLSSGASMGLRYGPLVIASKPFPPSELAGKTIAIPGIKTSAYLALKLFQPEFTYQIIPFDKILEAVQKGVCEAGLLIHEGQLTYKDLGLHKIIDLGEWWYEETGLPLPLGGNVIRRDLGWDLIPRISAYLKQSIHYALTHREEALVYAANFARGLKPKLTDKFVSMYVNELTLDFGESGRKAIQLFLEKGYQKGIIPHPVEVTVF
ncbi:MAG TPA: MqnA/MqnD/SBP family protein [Candidatus Limnocylindrales bacterium]|nr:MqnA/MqnD/SBP family protein [Candidatus Limnocylindrales bacterium]